MKEKNELIVSIDLGTTSSEIGFLNKSGIPEVITCQDGKQQIISLVSYASGKPIVGAGAKPDLVLAPKFVVKCGKRHMGKETADKNPIPILTDPSGKQITAVDSSAAIVASLKESAEVYLGGKIENGLITVPAYFDEAARNHTKAAARIAGFKIFELRDEPVAAATYYGLSKGLNETIVVIDYGGGTLDITVVEIKEGKVTALITYGDCELGGENSDEVILGIMCQEAKKAGFEISAEQDLPSYYQNLERAKEAKELLGQRDEVVVIIEVKDKRTTLKLTRQMFREVSKEPDNRFIGCCKKVHKELTARKKKIDRIILVGGSSRLFHVPEMVEKVFGIKPLRDTDPDLAIVKGGIILAESIFGDGEKQLNLGGHMYLATDIKAQTVTAHAICIAARKTADSNDEKEYNVEIVPANTPLPYEFQVRFAPLNPSQRSVVIKILQGKAGELSNNSTLLRKIEVPIDPSEKDTDRILVKGKYTEEGLLEITIMDEDRGEPFSESFIHSAG